ncbi:MinD/ParA family protein [Kitasatospora sp. NPDC057542]|uniref:MinD/ParA family ATP-binding protein n=1 Tax=Kitasatospora sp. NPDC057542 TaxID=3346162 RepID=UPI00367D35B7
MAFSDGAAGAGTTTPAAPDYSPAAWPEPVPLLPRSPLDPLGTVLIPPAERQLFTRDLTVEPTSAAPQPAVPPTEPPPGGQGAWAAPGLLPAPPAQRPGTDRPRARLLPLPGSGEARRRRLLERVRVPLRACHRIAVLGGPAEGAVTVLGALLAEHRADPVLVLTTAGSAGSECRPGGRLVLRSVRPDPAALREALGESGGHYPVVLADTTGAGAEVQLAAVEHADQLVLCAPASAAGARTADALLDHLTALGHDGLVRGAAAVFTPAPATDRPIADRDLLPHFRTRCRGALTVPAHPHADPAALRSRARLDYLELAALIGDGMADRQG